MKKFYLGFLLLFFILFNSFPVYAVTINITGELTGTNFVENPYGIYAGDIFTGTLTYNYKPNIDMTGEGTYDISGEGVFEYNFIMNGMTLIENGTMSSMISGGSWLWFHEIQGPTDLTEHHESTFSIASSFDVYEDKTIPSESDFLTIANQGSMSFSSVFWGYGEIDILGEVYGTFKTSSLSPVPEPSTMFLVLIGFLLVSANLRKNTLRAWKH